MSSKSRKFTRNSPLWRLVKITLYPESWNSPTLVEEFGPYVQKRHAVKRAELDGPNYYDDNMSKWYGQPANYSWTEVRPGFYENKSDPGYRIEYQIQMTDASWRSASYGD